MLIATFILVVLPFAAGHFSIDYPEWRADSLNNESYSQWTWPCAGVDPEIGNVTAWPLTGGSLKLHLHHPWTYVFVNLGLGKAVINFNYTLTNSLWNETGNGTLCIPHLPLPADPLFTDGKHASLQVVTSGESGSALYNCANIVLQSNATLLADNECTNTTGITLVEVTQQSSGSSPGSATNTTGDGGNTSTTPGGSGGGRGAGASFGVNMIVLTSALALTFVFGLNL